MKHVLLILTFTCFFGYVKAQTNCDSIYEEHERYVKDKVGLVLFDTPPILLSDRKLLNINQYCGMSAGEVFVTLIVDASGQPTCLKTTTPIKSQCDSLALSTTRSFKFTPAKIRGRAIPAIMYLRFSFNKSH